MRNWSKRYELAGPIGRAALAALADEFNARLRLVAVHELAESPAFFRIANHGRPLALVRIDEPLRHRFQLGGDAQLVVDDDVANVIDAAFELFQPHARSREPIGRHDVIRQESIDVLKRRFLVEITRQQIGVTRLGAAVAADV